MTKHIVTFQLAGTPEERHCLALKFKNALLELPCVIDVLESMEVGVNQNPVEEWDVALTAIVPTMADVATYAAHPAHLAAAAILKGHVRARACVDYDE